jgi:hypothetical protein
LGSPSSDAQVGFSGNLMVSEQLGDEQLLAVRIGQGELRVSGVDPELALAGGARVDLAAPLDSLHIFDAASGAAIR